MPYINTQVAVGWVTLSTPFGRFPMEMCESLGCPGFTAEWRRITLRGTDIASVFGEERQGKMPREVPLNFRLTLPSDGSIDFIPVGSQFWIASDREVRTWPFWEGAHENDLELTTAPWQFPLYDAMMSALTGAQPVRIAVHNDQQRTMTEFKARWIANTTGDPRYKAENVICKIVGEEIPVGAVLS